MIRAKFKVQSVTKQAGWTGAQSAILYVVKLCPVTGGSDENKRFYEATPSGTIELGVLREGVGAQFDIGQEFYVDFTPAEVA